MKYNRALDFLLLAAQATKHGKNELAAKHFAKATIQPDIDDAIRVLEASNARAWEAHQAELTAKAKAKKVEASKATPSTKRLRASEEIIDDGANDGEEIAPELGAELVEDEVEIEDETGDDEELLSGDLSDLEDEAEEAEEGVDVQQFAAVLASMRRQSGRTK